MSKDKRSEKTQDRIEWGMIIAGLILMLAVAGILGYKIYEREKQRDRLLGTSTPFGDESSGDFVWEGDYIEQENLAATMTVKKNTVGSSYAITVTWSDADGDELVIWTMTGYYDDSLRVMSYKDCARTDHMIPESEGDSVAHKVYTNAEGYFYVKKKKVYWKDATEDFGEGMIFKKVKSQQQ